jgi:hypothetical protein
MRPRAGLALTLLATTLSAPGAARAGAEATASAAATVQPGGPRAGAPGKTFFNIEGKGNGIYAAFGVLDFQPAKPEKEVGKVAKLTLTLTQSIARFSKDGAVRVWVATDVSTGLERDSSPLKFDTKAEGGVGSQLDKRLPLEPARFTFTKRKNGDADAIVLTPAADTEEFLRRQLNSGGVIRLVVTPSDDDVAATYLGPGAEQTGSRPRLTLDTAS